MAQPIIQCVVCREWRRHVAKAMCRPCYGREYYRTHPRAPTPRVPVIHFDCQRCGKPCSATAGRKNRTHCADCWRYLWSVENRDRLNARHRQLRQEKLEEHRARDRRWYRANRKSRAASSRRYRTANLEKIREREHCYDAARAESKRAYARQWQKDNPARHAANERARRARQAGLFVEYVHPLVVLELSDGLCGICGEDVDPANYQVDHIKPLSLGGEHSYANTQPAHPICNMRKGARSAA